MEVLIYVVLPFFGIVIWMGYLILEELVLNRKMDNYSRMKREARRRHYNEDHNSHLTTRNSLYLWNSREDDEGINKKLIYRAKAKK